jgi:hypothetical protein
MLAALVLTAVVAAGAREVVPAAPGIYRVELGGSQSAWAIGKPQPNGPLLLFRRYPDGALMSVRAKDVKRIVAVAGTTGAPKSLRPGQAIEIGATGGGGAPTGTAAAAGSKGSGPLAPGEGKGGTALLNPNRPYLPDWDSKQVPGMNIPYPNSPNDYQEGRTFAHPPASAVQAAPGEPPKAPQSSGDVPH